MQQDVLEQHRKVQVVCLWKRSPGCGFLKNKSCTMCASFSGLVYTDKNSPWFFSPCGMWAFYKDKTSWAFSNTSGILLCRLCKAHYQLLRWDFCAGGDGWRVYLSHGEKKRLKPKKFWAVCHVESPSFFFFCWLSIYRTDAKGEINQLNWPL